ncbi:NYN domain-containing protein [Salinisphaera sp.]|uniref:NYN domain-containing protein n=1 Tax=Salinisphaera sp. TaxID=1914330 RepID=UPI000C6603AC|nr:NYN domain-containing protein [Salinisphaera sp.]MBS62826.1 Maebl [Salinisphaera sp.]
MAVAQHDKLAVLIDADNAQAKRCSQLLAEVASFGLASVKRAYGDWTTAHLKGWKEQLNEHAIQPIQQFGYTTGKNATDSALIIDAMDLLHQGHLDGFVLVSSDSDFTRLATRIRESGLLVYGFGEKKTPKAFVSACDRFLYTEVLDLGDRVAITDESKNAVLRRLMESAVSAVSKDDGWASLAAVGSQINKNDPSFDARNYGYQKLGQLVHALNYVEVEDRHDDPASATAVYYVRIQDPQIGAG